MRNLAKPLAIVGVCVLTLLVAPRPACAQFRIGLGGVSVGGSSGNQNNHNNHNHNNHNDHNHGNHNGSWGVYDNHNHNHQNHNHGGYNNYYNNGNYSGYGQNRNYSNYHGANALPYRPSFYSGAPIQIVNPAQTGGSLHYDLNAYHYDIGPGQAQTIAADRAWTVQFDRGGGFGPASYSLTPGVYTFAVTDHGWELFKQKSVSDAPPPPVALAP